MSYAPSRAELVTDYVAGRLSPAKHIIMECQRRLCQQTELEIATEEHLAALLFLEEPAQPLSQDFITRAMDNLPGQPANDREGKAQFPIETSSLNKLLNQGVDTMKWNALAPGVAVKDVLGDRRAKSGERLYFMRAKSGTKMPQHTHSGEEWTLIIRGEYAANGEKFARGDLHISNGDDEHAPEVFGAEDCVCLVMSEAPLVMKSLMARIAQPFIGI